MKTILGGLVIFFVFCTGFVNAQLLNPNEIGFNGQTRDNNYEELLNSIYTNGKVVTSINDKMWVPWFKTSSGCQQSDLQSGNSCKSGQTIDFEHNCMVTDEFSQVGIIVAMGKSQSKMDEFYNTLGSIKSTFGELPAWRIYRDGNAIQPCMQGINGNCDTASDASARIIISLYTAANNPYFTNEAKSKYLELANTLASDMMTYEVEQKCYPTNTGYGQACYWLAGGSQVKRGSFASTDYAYTGYYADAIIAMLMACKQTGNQKYCDAAKDFTLNYFQAARTNGETFRVPPGLAFKWQIDSEGVPQAICTRVCNPDRWDFADAPRAFGLCHANHYAKLMDIQLPGLDNYCKVWGDKYATNTNSIIIQYNADGSPAASSVGGYYYQGLQSLFQPGYNTDLFKPTLDNALKHYSSSSKTWDNEPCYGIYTKAFAVRALGFGIGRDLNVFESGAIVPPINYNDPADNPVNPPPSSQPEPIEVVPPKSSQPNTMRDVDIASLSASCDASSMQCTLKSDITTGVCRTLVYATPNGDILVLGCKKEENYVELYRQAAPNDLSFSICLANGCLEKGWGFARFVLEQSSVPDTDSSPIPDQEPAPQMPPDEPSDEPNVPIPTDQFPEVTGPAGIIGLLPTSCVANGLECTLKSDITTGVCRTLVYATPKGDILVLGCEKENDYVELYRQAFPAGLDFSACMENECVDRNWGFARFLPSTPQTNEAPKNSALNQPPATFISFSAESTSVEASQDSSGSSGSSGLTAENDEFLNPQISEGNYSNKPHLIGVDGPLPNNANSDTASAYTSFYIDSNGNIMSQSSNAPMSDEPPIALRTIRSPFKKFSLAIPMFIGTFMAIGILIELLASMRMRYSLH